MSDLYVNLEDLFEPIIEDFKNTLRDMEVFDRVSEGEELYELMTQEAWVVPGRDRIESGGMHMLRHFLEVNVIIFNSEGENASQTELRLLAEQAYNELMQDVTHGGTCHWALPTLFHPGYVQIGGATVVGVLIQFICNFEQFYPLPS